MPVTLLSNGVPTLLVANQVYAMPASSGQMSWSSASGSSVEGSNDSAGPWSSLGSSSAGELKTVSTGARFIRTSSSNTTATPSRTSSGTGGGGGGGGTGDVVGPGTATDNAIVRFDGTTGKLVQSSLAIIDDAGAIVLGTSPNTLTVSVSGPNGLISPKVGALILGSQDIPRWAIDGSFYPLVDNTLDIGVDGGRVRSGVFGTSVQIGTNPASTGAIRLANAGNIVWKSGTVGDCLIFSDSTDAFFVVSPASISFKNAGSTAGWAVQTLNAANSAIYPLVDNQSDVGGAANRAKTLYLSLSAILSGSTTGAVTVRAQATAGTWTFRFPNSAGAAGQFLVTDGGGTTSWTNSIAVSANDVTPLSITGQSITGSNQIPFFSLVGTWNTTGVITAARINITNTASPATSLLLDLQLDSASKFSVQKDGMVTALLYKTSTANVALGGGGAPTLGTIGGSGPATAAQNSWLKMIDSTGASIFIPIWK